MELKTKIKLSALLFFLISIVWVIFIFIPLYKSIRRDSHNLDAQKRELLSLEEKIKNIEKFRDDYPNVKKDLEKANSLFISPEAPVGFISFLEKTSQESQMEIEISPSSKEKRGEDDWDSIVFQINTVCPFPYFVKFLERIENGSYLLDIQSIHSSSAGKQSEGLKERPSLQNVRVGLSIKAFTY